MWARVPRPPLFLLAPPCGKTCFSPPPPWTSGIQAGLPRCPLTPSGKLHGNREALFWPPLVSPEVPLPLNALGPGGGLRFMGCEGKTPCKPLDHKRYRLHLRCLSDALILAQVGPKGPTPTSRALKKKRQLVWRLQTSCKAFTCPGGPRAPLLPLLP